MTAPTTKLPERRMPESVKAFLLGDAYNGDPPGATAGGAILAPAQPFRERSTRSMREYAYAKAARAAAENHPDITADVLRRCEEDGLTAQQAADELGVARSTVMKLRRHYGLAKPRAQRPGAPAAAGPIPPPLATEVSAAVLSTLPIAPFALRQRGRFNAAKLARRLAGVVALFERQEAEDEFELELVIRQVEPTQLELCIRQVDPSRLTDAQLADLTKRIRELAGISVESPAMAGQPDPGPPEGGDDAA